MPLFRLMCCNPLSHVRAMLGTCNPLYYRGFFPRRGACRSLCYVLGTALFIQCCFVSEVVFKAHTRGSLGKLPTAAEAVKQSVAAYPAGLRLEFRDGTLSLNKKLPLEVKLPAWYSAASNEVLALLSRGSAPWSPGGDGLDKKTWPMPDKFRFVSEKEFDQTSPLEDGLGGGGGGGGALTMDATVISPTRVRYFGLLEVHLSSHMSELHAFMVLFCSPLNGGDGGGDDDEGGGRDKLDKLDKKSKKRKKGKGGGSGYVCTKSSVERNVKNLRRRQQHLGAALLICFVAASFFLNIILQLLIPLLAFVNFCACNCIGIKVTYGMALRLTAHTITPVVREMCVCVCGVIFVGGRR